MDDFLTSRQVQHILKVDRITVYRMLQDGRLKGVKIGQQWRFQRSEVERMVGGSPQPTNPAQDPESPFPTHCVQTIQDLFSDVGQISAVVVDASGAAVTEVSRPCAFCQLILASPSGRRACGASWENVAENCAAGSKYFTCHAGLQYVAAPIQDRGQRVGAFLAGQFYWQPADPREQTERIRRLAEAHGIPQSDLAAAADEIAVIPPDQHVRTEAWPFTASRAVESILCERSGFMERLKQIANLTQLSKGV